MNFEEIERGSQICFNAAILPLPLSNPWNFMANRPLALVVTDARANVHSDDLQPH